MRWRFLLTLTVGLVLLGLSVIAFVPAWAGNSPPKPTAPYAPGRLIVGFKSTASAATAQAVLADQGVQAVKQIPGLNAAVVAVAAGDELTIAQQLRRNASVRYAEPDYIVHAFDVQRVPNDPYYVTDQWNLPQINAPAAWDLTTGAVTITIAVVDTGVDLGHPDLASKIVLGYDFVNSDDSAQDDEGHGTHVAGIAAAASNNAIGVAGVAWAASIMPVKVLDHAGSGFTSDVAAGIAWAADHGARVINLSLGGPGSSQALQDAVTHAYSLGALVIAAAGNEYQTGNPTNYPAACLHAVGVAATTDADGHASYSSVGSWVDVAAPGGDPTSSSDPNPRHWIMSTYWRGASSQGIQAAYERHAGTSMATPHVVGLAALIFARHPGWTPDQVEWAIESTAVDLGQSGRDNLYGWGRIDAGAAVALNTLTPTPTPTPSNCLAESAHPYANSANQTWTVTNSDPDAIYTKLLFSRLETESNYDFVTIKDAAGTVIQRLSGVYPGEVWSAGIPGRTVQIQLTSDDSVAAWGFCVTRAQTTAAPPWAVRAALSVPRSRLALAAVNGKLYAIGGESANAGQANARRLPAWVAETEAVQAYSGVVEAYDPATNTWTPQASMPVGVSNISAAVIEGKIYVPGGYNDDGNSLALQVYDPVTNSWANRAALPSARVGSAVAALNGRLYVIGGTDESAVTNACLRYDPSANTWAQCAALSGARGWAGAGVVNGKLYVVGGLDAADNEVKTIEEYDPITDRWSLRAPMSVARGGPGLIGVGDYLYAIGGGWSSYLASVERFNPASNRWETVDPLTVGRRTMGVAELAGKIYAVGGYNGTFSGFNEAYTPPSPVPYPNIVVAPSNLSATTPLSGSAQSRLVISNTGAGPLTYSIGIAETTSAVAVTIQPPSVSEVRSAALKTATAPRVDSLTAISAPRGLRASAPVKVLIVTADADVSDLVAMLSAFPDLTVTVYNAAAVPSLAQLQAHQVVLTSDNQHWAAGGMSPVALGNVLADYIDGGGKVLVANYGYDYTLWAIQGRFLDQDYGPFERATADLANPVTLGTFTAGHPIMTGVTSLAEGSIHQDPRAGTGATLVASWSDGTPLLATRPAVVGLNLLLSLGNGGNNWTGNAPTLAQNALVWLAGSAATPWLVAEPTSGLVSPGSSASVTVTFDATRLAAGVYTANLLVNNNDPAHAQVIVPVTLTVNAAPAPVTISVDPPAQLTGPGGIFTLSLRISSGQQGVDSADARLTFDPAHLRVVDANGQEVTSITPATALPLVLQNIADNSTGQITFSAGRGLTGTIPSGEFALATVRFKAVAETGADGVPISFITGTQLFFGGDPILRAAQDGAVFIREPVLVGQVALQGRGQPPSARWAGYDVRVTLYPTGVPTATQSVTESLDARGVFTMTGMATGAYDVVVKGPHALSVRKLGVALPGVTLPLDLGILREGDANGDDLVAGDDFSILAAAYAAMPGQPSWDSRADFNGDGVINGADFSLLVTNYGRHGSAARLGFVPQATSASSVSLRADAPVAPVGLGDWFAVQVTVGAEGQGVDSVDAYLQFDPAHLRVVDASGHDFAQVTPGISLPLVLQNIADNATGLIAFSAGRAFTDVRPSGNLRLATIWFKALAPTGPAGTSVRFVSRTGVFAEGDSILGATTDGVIVVAPVAFQRVYTPLLLK